MEYSTEEGKGSGTYCADVSVCACERTRRISEKRPGSAVPPARLHQDIWPASARASSSGVLAGLHFSEKLEPQCPVYTFLGYSLEAINAVEKQLGGFSLACLGHVRRNSGPFLTCLSGCETALQWSKSASPSSDSTSTSPARCCEFTAHTIRCWEVEPP